jgi:DNA-binding NtrC family response regulator
MLSGFKVLIVDDEEVVADTPAIILRQQGYECEVAYRGNPGIQIAQRVHPHVLLMDTSLPDRWGTEVAKIVLDQQPDCKVILYSGAENAERNQFEPLRRHGYEFEALASPLDIQILLRILRDYKQKAGESTDR